MGNFAGRVSPISVAVALVVCAFSVSVSVADPVDPSIIVRGARAGSFPIDEPVEILYLTETFFNSYSGDFFVDVTPPLGSSFSLVFKNATSQPITSLTVRFAYDDFYGPGGFQSGDDLVFNLFFSPESPFTSGSVTSDGPGGFVTWTLLGYLPPAEPTELLASLAIVPFGVAPPTDPGYFELEFNDFPVGMSAVVSVPEPATLLLGVIGLGALGLRSRLSRS